MREREVIRLVDKRNSKEKEGGERSLRENTTIKKNKKKKEEEKSFTLSLVLIALRSDSDLLVIIIIRQPINFFLSPSCLTYHQPSFFSIDNDFSSLKETLRWKNGEKKIK